MRRRPSAALSEEEMDQSVKVVKARLTEDSYMMDYFMIILRDVMSHVSITEKQRWLWNCKT